MPHISNLTLLGEQLQISTTIHLRIRNALMFIQSTAEVITISSSLVYEHLSIAVQ